MKILFRADASLQIGTGHVMRCLTLAEALRQQGSVCSFVCRAHHGNMLEIIRQHGFEIHMLPLDKGRVTSNESQGESLPPYESWLGTDWQTDARQTLAAIGKTQFDWLIVDHYALDARWERKLRSNCRHLMVIDDLADRPHSCDILLDQNLGREMKDYSALVDECCTLFVGPRYALLRQEFSALREYSLCRRDGAALNQILITMGGVDQPNATGQVLEALKDCQLPLDCRIIVVMGAQAQWLQQVRALAAKMPWPTEVRVNINDMAQVMADSDLAIGAAGSTSWERCCLGLPTLLCVLAENQRQVAVYLEQEQAVVMFSMDEGLHDRVCEQIRQMVVKPQIMQTMTNNAASITDGLGCKRVLTNLMKA